MAERVTVLDIANRVGLSKNTVSKILNGKYTGPDETRERVLKTVVEMRYREYGSLGELGEESKGRRRNVVLLSKKSAQNFSFYSEVLNGVESILEKTQVNLMVSIVRYSEMTELRLPPNISTDTVDGIICLEIFRRDYFQKLLRLRIPTVTIDGYYMPGEIEEPFDMILMEQDYYVGRMTKKLLEHGRRIGFVGAPGRCRSFYERYRGYKAVMRDVGHTEHQIEEDGILDTHGPHYYETSWMAEKLKMKSRMPDSFVCASDRLAVVLIQSLTLLGLRVPEDVEVVSFDNSPEAELIIPNLTTAGLRKDEMGRCAAECLLERMAQPEKTARTVYLKTRPYLRDSARFRDLNGTI